MKDLTDKINKVLASYNAVQDNQMSDIPYTVWIFKVEGKKYSLYLQEVEE